MDLRRSVDLYCERTGPEFWSEPVNALSNVAFVVAAALIVRHARARGEVAPDAWLLAALVALVGAGSFLFHTLATVWAGWLDVIFILAFIYAFLARFLARVAGWGWQGIAAGLAGYWLVSRVVTLPFPAKESLRKGYGASRGSAAGRARATRNNALRGCELVTATAERRFAELP